MKKIIAVIVLGLLTSLIMPISERWVIVSRLLHQSSAERSTNPWWKHPQGRTFYYLLNNAKPIEVLPPHNHPPLHIVIGNHAWTVHYTTNEELKERRCAAFEDNDAHKIWLSHTEPSADMQDSLLHEILHAVLSESRAGKSAVYGQDENTFVSPMTPQLLQVLQDNPALVVWLRRKQ